MIPLRPGTSDVHVWKEVFIENEYRLPDRMDGWRVLDVGANIGTFTLACLVRGAVEIESFESDPENYAILEKALKHRFWADVRPSHAAVWRSDVDPGEIMVGKHSWEIPAANGAYVGTTNIPVPTVPLDEEIRAMDFDGKGVDLLKIDAEGSEFPILLTSKELGRVRSICGEWHEVCDEVSARDGLGEYTGNRLRDHLILQGFTTDFRLGKCGYQGPFWATRLPYNPFKGK